MNTGFEYFGDIDTKQKLELILADYDFAKLLAYEPVSRTNMSLELRELCQRFKLETPGYITGFIDDPNAWTEVALRMDVGQTAPYLDALNTANGTNYKNFSELKKSAFGAGAQALDDIEEVTAASEEDAFVSLALSRFNAGKV